MANTEITNLFESTQTEKKKLGATLEVEIRSQFTFAFQASALRKFRQVLKDLREVLGSMDSPKGSDASRLDQFEDNVEYSLRALDVEYMADELEYFAGVAKKAPKSPLAKDTAHMLDLYTQTFKDAFAGRF